VLQGELVVLVHNLKVANARLILANLMGSIETSADIRAEVITWIQLLIAGRFLALVIIRQMGVLTLAQDCE
jgi:hypothetical protein